MLSKFSGLMALHTIFCKSCREDEKLQFLYIRSYALATEGCTSHAGIGFTCDVDVLPVFHSDVYLYMYHI